MDPGVRPFRQPTSQLIVEVIYTYTVEGPTAHHAPPHGWGEVRLGGALTSPGPLFTADGSAIEEKSLKQRSDGEIRAVPLPPPLVDWLRWHIAEFEKSEADRLFTNLLGNDLTKDNWGKPWRVHRSRRWPTSHEFAKIRPYDLRHVAATMMLRAGVPAAEVALRLGHSIDMLMKIYAGVFDDERERANQLIAKELQSGVVCD